MSEAVLVALIAGAPATITSIVAAIMAWRGRSASTADNKGTRDAVDKLEKQINSNLEKYIQGAIENALSKERLAVQRDKK